MKAFRYNRHVWYWDSLVPEILQDSNIKTWSNFSFLAEVRSKLVFKKGPIHAFLKEEDLKY